MYNENDFNQDLSGENENEPQVIDSVQEQNEPVIPVQQQADVPNVSENESDDTAYTEPADFASENYDYVPPVQEPPQYTAFEETQNDSSFEQYKYGNNQQNTYTASAQPEEAFTAENNSYRYNTPNPSGYNPERQGYNPADYDDSRNNAQQSGYNPYVVNNSREQYGNRQFNPAANYNHIPAHKGNNKKNPGMKTAICVIASCVVVAILVIALSFGGSTDSKPTTTAASDVAATSQSVSATGEQQSNNVQIATTNASSEQKDAVWIAEKVRPSVVGVIVYQDGQLAGEGSGVLMSESGEYTYVVTCDHVVNATGVTYGILLLDGRSFEAELVAGDTRTDIAVLKVKQTGLPVAEFGDSSSLKVGETIYAIGNPGGSEYFGSMTDGIVSAIDRSITATYTMTCIQHNAAINPGNSGGALVNSQGQIIGINSSKIASTEYEGMGFAVPTAIAKPVVDALIQYGYVPNRPKLGIEYAPVSSYQLYSMVVSIKGLPKGSLVIAGISEDSSLVNTDAQVGDLIIGVNGKDMDDSSVLLDLINTGAVGDTITLTLCRIESRTYKTSTFDVTITLIEDKGATEQEETTEPEAYGGYYYGGSENFEDFFNDYFGEFGEFGW